MKTFLGLGFALAFVLSAGAGHAQPQPDRPYPDRPVRIIVPFAPAGLTDVVARIVAEKLTARLGTRF
jgi:tripartite-type tricarboxylate transporter receptor subunit TctC